MAPVLRRHPLGLIGALLLGLCLILPAAAQDLPDWQDTNINDFAGLLGPDDRRHIDQALIELHQQTGIEGTVVTLPDRQGRDRSDGLEAFATQLFNHWGIGDATRNDGFLLLVLANDRETRIELGAGYSPEADIIAQDIMRHVILPEFRDGRMAAGIRAGLQAIIDHIARPVAAGNAPQPVRKPVPWVPALIGAGIFVVVLQGIARGVLARNRQRRRPCPNCGQSGLINDIAPAPADDSASGPPPQQSRWTRCPRCGWKAHTPRNGRRGRSSQPARSRGGFGGGRSRGGGASGRW